MFKIIAKNRYFLKKPRYDSSSIADVSSCQMKKGLTGYYKGRAPPLRLASMARPQATPMPRRALGTCHRLACGIGLWHRNYIAKHGMRRVAARGGGGGTLA